MLVNSERDWFVLLLCGVMDRLWNECMGFDMDRSSSLLLIFKYEVVWLICLGS